MDLRSSGRNISSDMLGRHWSQWYKNGASIRDGSMYNSSVINEQGLIENSLQITYNIILKMSQETMLA